MKFSFKIVKLPKISGRRTTFYTAYLPKEETTLFEQFLEATQTTHLPELTNILNEIQVMSDKTGAREDLFKKYEGIKIGEGVYAFFSKQLRLYCYRMDNCLVLLGGGGWKNVAKWQDDPSLANEVNRVRFVASEIDKRIRNREIKRSSNDMDLIGDLIFDLDDDLD